MTSHNRATLPNASRAGRFLSTSVIALSLLTLALSPRACADDLTGMPQDDPKDLLPTPPTPSQPTCPTGTIQFVSMPSWARGVNLGPLPAKLMPMGRDLTAPVKPAPQPLAPPKDGTTTASTTPTDTTASPKPADTNSPTLLAVSPFLQWIKANPQAAAAAARQQARSYGPPPSPNAPASPAAANVPSSTDDSYWLPPLIDSSEFGTRTVGGSAAIYSTPQR